MALAGEVADGHEEGDVGGGEVGGAGAAEIGTGHEIGGLGEEHLSRSCCGLVGRKRKGLLLFQVL